MSLLFYEEEFQYIFAGVSWVRVSKNGTRYWVGSRDLTGLCLVTALRATGRSKEQQARGMQLLPLCYLALPLLLFPSCASAFYFCRFSF